MSLTDSDTNMVKYFWQEKGDIERWSSWEEKLPLFIEEYPELVTVLINYKTSKKILDIVVENL